MKSKMLSFVQSKENEVFRLDQSIEKKAYPWTTSCQRMGNLELVMFWMSSLLLTFRAQVIVRADDTFKTWPENCPFTTITHDSRMENLFSLRFLISVLFSRSCKCKSRTIRRGKQKHIHHNQTHKTSNLVLKCKVSKEEYFLRKKFA